MFGLFGKKSDDGKNQFTVRTRQDYDNPQPIADYFKHKTGISFEKQTAILKSKLTSFCKLRDINSFADCLNQIQKDRNLEQELVNYLTTNETYFYREFAQIEQMIKQIIQGGKRVDILSAPCSTGEEPYSIAIALLEAGVPSNQFRILGIDISDSAVDQAKTAIYNDRNVSRMPTSLVTKYFDKKADGLHYLDQKIKQLISFKTLNIFEPGIQHIGKFDFILSRNMLIYFDMPTKKKASAIMESLLKDPSHKILYGHADLY